MGQVWNRMIEPAIKGQLPVAQSICDSLLGQRGIPGHSSSVSMPNLFQPSGPNTQMGKSSHHQVILETPNQTQNNFKLDKQSLPLQPKPKVYLAMVNSLLSSVELKSVF